MTSLSRRAIISGSIALAMPHIARAAPRVFRVGHNAPSDSVTQAAAAGLHEALYTASGGRLGLEILPNSIVGTELQMLKAVAEGVLDGTVCTTGTISTLDKQLSLVETPYLFTSVDQARAAFDGALGRHCSTLAVAKNVAVVGWSEVGLRHMTANKPIRSPADLKGLKLRLPYSETMLESFKAVGAAAEPMAFAQLMEALRTGRFDAEDNPVNIIVSAKLHQVQSTLSMTGHVYTACGIAFSADVMEELPEADRSMIGTAARSGITASRALADKMEKDGIALLRTAGMSIVTDVDMPAMRAAALAARDRLAEVFGAATVQQFAALAAQGTV